MNGYVLPEVISFLISLAAFIFGAVNLFKKGIPMYFKLFGIAEACYAIEELWVVINTMFGTEDPFVSVRLFGTFGFFCFILSANVGEFDRTIDEGKEESKKARRLAFIAPAFFFMIYILSAFLLQEKGVAYLILEFIVFLPVFLASYFCLKHLLLPTDSLGFLTTTKEVDIVSLVLFLVNFGYVLDILDGVPMLINFYDIFAALIAALLTICSVKGAKRWKTLL